MSVTNLAGTVAWEVFINFPEKLLKALNSSYGKAAGDTTQVTVEFLVTIFALILSELMKSNNKDVANNANEINNKLNKPVNNNTRKELVKAPEELALRAKEAAKNLEVSVVDGKKTFSEEDIAKLANQLSVMAVSSSLDPVTGAGPALDGRATGLAA